MTGGITLIYKRLQKQLISGCQAIFDFQNIKSNFQGKYRKIYGKLKINLGFFFFSLFKSKVLIYEYSIHI